MNNFQYNYFNYKPNKSEKNQLSNYPFRLIYIYICRVTVFWLGLATNGDLGPTDPIQWICREWVQNLDSDGATACVEIGDDQAGAKNRTRRPNAPRERTSHLRIWIPALSHPPPSSLLVGDLWYYISLPLVHLLRTLVSHPCP